jgi:hypothetical protein
VVVTSKPVIACKTPVGGDDIESPQFADNVRNTLIDDELLPRFVSTSSSGSEGKEKIPHKTRPKFSGHFPNYW